MPPSSKSTPPTRYRIWDLPTRIFHWLLLLCFVGAIVSVNMGRMQVHLFFGASLLTLVLFRILWGFAGSQTSRFQFFLPSPKALVSCLKAFFQKNQPHIGHDAMGGLATIALLAILLVTPVIGMFANDDVLFEGPLAPLISKPVSNFLTFVHKQLATLAITLVSFHIAVVLFNWLYKKDNLVSPMFYGDKILPSRLAQKAASLRFAPTRRAVFCFVLTATLVASIVLL